MNWKITPILLATFVFIIGSSQAFGQPISCFHPQEIKVWYKYVSAYCFLEGSYALRANESVTEVLRMTPADRERRQLENPVEYYQWVGFVLAFQLICFLLPGVFWKWARKRYPLDLDTVIESSESIRNAMAESKERQAKMDDLVEYVYETLRETPDASFRDHQSLTVLLLAIKIFTLINAINQFILLVHFVGDESIFFGYEIFWSLVEGATTSRFFPLVVMCNLRIGKLGQGQDYTMQCLLPLNFFHDKIFAVLWAWYLFLIAYSICSFLLLALSLLPLDMNMKPLVATRLFDTKKRQIRNFYSKMLFTDGALMLKFIAKIKGRHIVNELVEALYDKFEQDQAETAWIYPTSLRPRCRSKGSAKHR